MSLTVEHFTLSDYQSNCYVVRTDEAASEAAVIDPGGDPRALLAALSQRGVETAGILVTHADIDHVDGVAALASATGADVWAPAGEIEALRTGQTRTGTPFTAHDPEHAVSAGDEVTVAGITFVVVDIPGHSAGHVAFAVRSTIFSGDLLFAGSVGRVDLPGGDWETLLDSVNRLIAQFGRDAVVYPGHGETTLGQELDTNPFLAGSSAPQLSERQVPSAAGAHDVLPAEQPIWFDTVVRTMEELTALYGYRRIQTPVFEDTELFQRTAGAGSDVVSKEMYTFIDRGDRSLTLRPEGTAPICRAYLEHGMQREPQPVKLYTIAPMYRYAAPQKGRYREHWQLSVEAIGSSDPALDAEVIQLYWALLGKLGVTEFELQLNSIGDAECRPAYLAALNAWLDAHADILDDDAREKRATSPLRVFDVKSPAVRAALEEAPKIGDSLCDACREHFTAVRGFLDAYGVPYTIDPTLVRGLDYYTRTTWEFVGPEAGAQSTLSGGGRYDGLIEEIGGPPTPGIGFGAGLERIVAAFQDSVSRAAQIFNPSQRRLGVFFVLHDTAPRELVLSEMMRLRNDGVSCDADYAGRSLKGQFTQAARLDPRIVVEVVDESEVTLRIQGEPDRSDTFLNIVRNLQ